MTLYIRPLVGAVLLTVLLAGCTSAPPQPGLNTPTGDAATPGSASSGSASPRATPSATPPAEPIDALGAVTSIIVRPEHLDLNDAAGATVRTLSYDAEAAEFSAAMSSLLHSEPTVTEHAGGHEWSAWTQYDWPGLQLNDDHEGGDFEQDMNLAVIFDAPTLGNGVSVATIQGFQPGGDLAWLADWMDEPYHPGGYNEIQAERGPEIGPRQSENYLNANSVTGRDFSGKTVIFAPWNFGIGHV
jgi:hypothetical protein